MFILFDFPGLIYVYYVKKILLLFVLRSQSIFTSVQILFFNNISPLHQTDQNSLKVLNPTRCKFLCMQKTFLDQKSWIQFFYYKITFLNSQHHPSNPGYKEHEFLTLNKYQLYLSNQIQFIICQFLLIFIAVARTYDL